MPFIPLPRTQAGRLAAGVAGVVVAVVVSVAAAGAGEGTSATPSDATNAETVAVRADDATAAAALVAPAPPEATSSVSTTAAAEPEAPVAAVAAVPPSAPVAGAAVVPDTASAVAGGYSFVQTAAAGPVRWNPCQAHAYEIDRRGAGEASVRAVHLAFEKVADATGLTFRFAGYVERGWTDIAGPVNVRWTTSSETPWLPSAALGAASPFATPTTAGPVFSSGSILFDRSRETTSNTALHEVSHIVGLGHVESMGEVMAEARSATEAFGLGDRAGLELLGAKAGCLPATPA